jgi:DNA-binding transcriptional LysR family regulator
MDLRQLEIFVKVAELKSFSKAAQALRLTQPTISEHIRTLEQELGVRLLDRLGRGAEATRAGQLLLSHATRMLQLQRETLQAMDSFQGRLAGRSPRGGQHHSRRVRAARAHRALQGEVPRHRRSACSSATAGPRSIG